MSARLALPVDEVLGELRAALETRGACVLGAPPGAGKTTRVPPALLGLAGEGSVLVLEPRRIAARASARRVAAELGEAVGETVGYQVRFERRGGRRTRLWYLTDGVFLRRVQEDPFLEGVACVVFDEFHERSLQVDLSLALARRVQREVRPELKLVVMSATLEATRVAEWLGGDEGHAPVVESRGRVFPVETEYLPGLAREPLEEHLERGVRRALEASDGSVLCFLPGVGEIRRARERVAGLVRARGAELAVLYGDLSPEEQDRALGAASGRRVTLATNVAETSLTLPGITAVVDTGLVRLLSHEPAVGVDRLRTVRVARDSADQRQGRAGRLAPGHCVRLWSRAEHEAMARETEPEVRRVDVTGAVLELLAFGESPEGFAWFEAPTPARLERAREVLVQLGALGASGLTDIGRQLARVPLAPRLARLLLEGVQRGVPERAALAAALLAERDPFGGEPPRLPAGAAQSDVLARVLALEEGREGISRRARSTLLRSTQQLERVAKDLTRGLEPGPSPGHGHEEDEALLRALLSAWPDRLARARSPDAALSARATRASRPVAGDQRRALMSGGRGVRLARESVVLDAPMFVCVEASGPARGGGELLVRQASVVEEDWLDEAGFAEEVVYSWDAEGGRVRASRVRAWHGLTLEETEVPAEDQAEVSRIIGEVASRDLSRYLPLGDDELVSLRSRVAFLRAALPELELPALDDGALRALLPTLSAGCRSLKDLKRLPLASALAGLLTHRQRSALEREAPERIEVPSGSRIRVVYEEGSAPVLAARIQELYGMHETPRLAAGRVPVVVHLLAPNGRPQQVTQDLGSFWRTTYHQVRKDLRTRYPKHSWPEDPLTARAERRPGRRPR